MRYIRRHPQILAYLILVLVNCFGWYLLNENAEQDQERARTFGVALCQANYDARASVLRFVEGQTAPVPVPAAPADAKAAAERTNERRAQLRADATHDFAEPSCVGTLGLRVDEGGKLVPR